MAAPLLLEELRARFGMHASREGGEEKSLAPKALSLGWPELDAALPEGGLPRGVVELASPHALGGGTCVALAAVRAAQAKDARAWCAWLDPEGTLYAPGVAMAGVDLARLLVVRPPRHDLGRFAVKVVAAGACDVIVVDMDAVPGALAREREQPRKRRKTWPAEVLVRKLALLAEDAGASILLLTDSLVPRAVSWPVALRLELSHVPHALSLSVAKDRRGKSGLAKTSIPLRTRPGVG
jgi:recombination protein RecA